MEITSTAVVFAGTLVAILTFGFVGVPLLLWTALAAGLLFFTGATTPVWTTFAIIAVVFNLPPLRTLLISRGVMALMKKLQFIPQISPTEQAALKSGDVWVESELFSGKPNFNRMLAESYPKLTPEEQAFIDGPVERLCAMVNDWDIWQRRDLPPEVWDFIKKERFFGMIIPKEYGGHGFSATCHSDVLQKIGSRSLPVCISVMVPNSLGPAELLLHYGTDEQKKYYLPRLARGEEIPCFALTEPTAGSDAASIQSSGTVFKGTDGKLYLKLNWNKRWITLASISTTLGLAFRLYDPENLLGKGVDIGITCALIPTKTPGITANRRHDPLGVPFYNCPTQGKDVVVSIDAIIGGIPNAGKGWLMLMECLAAGRGISLPAQSTGGAKYVARVASAHATVRKQFGMSIGTFEGIQEPLARTGALTYLLEGARRYTTGAIDKNIKPPVVTAMAKYYFTEISRKMVNDGMDILGGQAISQGPRNLMAHAYRAVPVCITVEGANILTRTLIIFGQGALRAHPYAYKEVDALERNDASTFDRAFWGHIGHVVRNTFRSILLSVTRGWLTWTPSDRHVARYWRRLNWASATFALHADLAMGSLGGKLKSKGKTTGRFADVLGWMYLATATLRRYEAEGRRKEDLPFVHWALQYAFHEIQNAFDGLFANMEMPGPGALLASIFRGPIRWYASLNPVGHMPHDSLDFQVARLMQIPGEQRDRIFGEGIYVPTSLDDQFGKLEAAFKLTYESDGVAAKVRAAVRRKALKKAPAQQLYKEAVEKGIITRAEFENVARAEELRNQVIQVDDFGLQEYVARGATSGTSTAGPAGAPVAGAGVTYAARSGAGAE